MNRNKSTFLFIIILAIISNSFAQSKPKTNRVKQAKRVVKSEKIIFETLENDDQVQKLGFFIQEAVTQDSIELFMSKFDTRAFGKFVTANTEKDRSLDEYKKGYLKGINKSITSVPKRIIEEINSGSYYDFVSFRYDEEFRTYFMLFRIFSLETGINYHDYRVSKRGNEYVFNDIYIYLSGETLSDSFNRMYLFSLPKNKLFGIFNTSETKDLNTLIEVFNLYRDEKIEESYNKLAEIKSDIAKDKFLLTLKSVMAFQISEEDYLKCIEELLQTFPDDPTLYLAETDYHIYKGDLDNALSTLNKLQDQTQDDFLNYLKGNLEFDRGNIKEAQKLYKYIIENYADFFTAYSNYLACISLSGEFNAGVDILENLTNLGYEKNELIVFVEELNEDGSNEFEAFAKSEEFINWKTL